MTKKPPSERFGNVRKSKSTDSESFGSVPNNSERTSDHILTVREVAKMFENAGVPRTERSIINYCQKDKHGIPRLENYFDENEHKYFISQNSVDRVIAEELNKLKKQGQNTASESFPNSSENPGTASEDFGNASDSFGKVPNSSAGFGNQPSDRSTRELEEKIRDLQITNKAKDMYIERMERKQDELFDRLTTASHKIGELEATVRQLEAPKQSPLPESEGKAEEIKPESTDVTEYEVVNKPEPNFQESENDSADNELSHPMAADQDLHNAGQQGL